MSCNKLVSRSKRLSKSALKEPPSSQLRIDAFFKISQKSYKIEAPKEEPTPFFRKTATNEKQPATNGKRTRTTATTATKKSSQAASKRRSKMLGRKRLFADESSAITEEEKTTFSHGNDSKRNILKPKLENNEDVIVLSDSEEGDREKLEKEIIKVEKFECKTKDVDNSKATSSLDHSKKSFTPSLDRTTPMSKIMITSPANAYFTPQTSRKTSATTTTTSKRKPKPCPPYKIIEDTTFAVDAFQYGCIGGVTHYFLTHFHADHYIGLTRKFDKPIYMSSITARFVRAFIPVDEQYIHELTLNTPCIVNDIEITALDANHCPGAIMLLFKFPNNGKCILHTGDFRAWHGMESEPVFWNNDITSIYLDTTYISNKYVFCTQYESIAKAIELVQSFREKHTEKRILFICGSYVIGKEKFWSALAEEFELKVWTEPNRSKALQALEDKELNKILVEDPFMADMHVITMGKISYLHLVDYFYTYESHYDILLAIRPSGWEKNSRPQYRGKINIIGIEYSEHSSYEEMQRFVKFLKPQNVISTVPTGKDLMKTAKVPEKWYKYDKLHGASNYQPCIEQFLGKTPKRQTEVRLPNEKNGGVERFVSPLKRVSTKTNKEINNNYLESIASDNFSLTEKRRKDKEEKLQRKAQIKIKHEQRESSLNLKDTSRAGENTKKQNALKNLLDIQSINTDLVTSHKDEEPCSIFLPQLQNVPVHKAPSSTKSSDYFENKPPLENGRRCPVSFQRNVRPGKKKGVKQIALATNIEDDAQNPALLKVKPTISSRRISLLRSASESWASSANSDKVPVKITPRPLRNKEMSTHDDQLSSQNDIVPASQTSRDLENTPRPIRNKKSKKVTKPLAISPAKNPSIYCLTEEDEDEFCHDLEKTSKEDDEYRAFYNGHLPTTSKMAAIMASKIEYSSLAKKSTPTPTGNKTNVNNSNHKPIPEAIKSLKNTQHILGSKIGTSKCHSQTYSSQSELIFASQTSRDLENTSRPIRNKRNQSMSSTMNACPLKKPKERNANEQEANNESEIPILTQILKKNQSIDCLNTSQMVSLVVDALADRHAEEKSLNHIPAELLSDPDAEDDWLD